MIQPLARIIRVFAAAGTLFLFFNCFGRRAKAEGPPDIHTVAANRLSVEQWNENNRKDFMDLGILMKGEIPGYLFTNLKIHDILIENMEIMEENLDNVQRLQQDMNSIMESLQESDGDSLQSLMDGETSYEQEIGSILSDIRVAQAEYEKGKKGLRQGLKMDRRRIIFIRDQTHSWKKEFHHLRYERAGLQQAVERFNGSLNEAIFTDNHSKKEILELSSKLEKYRNELGKIELFIAESERIAWEETGTWVCIRPMLTFQEGELRRGVPLACEQKYEQGLRDYKRILRDMSIELDSI